MNERERILKKRDACELGSPAYLMLTEVLLEIDGIKIHKETEEVCESCQ